MTAILKRYFPALLVATLPNSEEINNPSSKYTYTKSTPNHIHHHYAPSVTLTYTTHVSSSTAPHTHHIVTPGFVDRHRRSDCTAGQMDGETGWLTTYQKIRLPPLAMVMGVGKQQQPTPALCNLSVRTVVRLSTLDVFALGVSLIS